MSITPDRKMPERATAADAPTEAYRPPLSVTHRALLIERGGDLTDRKFRSLISDLLSFDAQMREARDRLGALIGISGPAYTLLMTVAHLQGANGVRVRDVARALHVTGAFVTAESGRLERLGLLEKHPAADDRRGVALRLSLKGKQALDRIAPRIRAVNDYVFGDLSAAEFAMLAAVAARLGNKSVAALFDVFPV